MNDRLSSFCLPVAAIAASLLTAPICARAQQTLYASTQNGVVDTISPAGVVATYATVGVFSYDHIFGLAFDGGGDLFALDESTNVISKVTPGGTVTPFALLPAAEGSGMTFNGGDLYTANYDTDTISKIDSAGVVTTYATLPKGSGPNDLAFDASGNLYVANQNTNTVSLITPGGVVSTFATFGKNAGTSGLAFDKNGNLYVSNDENGRIEVVTPDGTKSNFAKLGPDPEPFGLAFDQSGDLFVATITGVDEISPDGKTVSDYADVNVSNNGTNFLAFGPAVVPEPSTWALLCGGLISVAVAQRRRLKPAV